MIYRTILYQVDAPGRIEFDPIREAEGPKAALARRDARFRHP